MDADPAALADLADQLTSSKRNLRWATFLLAAMLVILLIDLQIKRSIARQAVEVAERQGKAAKLGDGRGTAADVAATGDDGRVGGGGGGDAVDGGPGVAAPADQDGGAKPSRGRGVAQRPERDQP